MSQENVTYDFKTTTCVSAQSDKSIPSSDLYILRIIKTVV